MPRNGGDTGQGSALGGPGKLPGPVLDGSFPSRTHRPPAFMPFTPKVIKDLGPNGIKPRINLIKVIKTVIC